MLVFHGTTLNRLLKILKDGYLGTEKAVWNASEPNTTYFYGEDKIKEEYEGNLNECCLYQDKLEKIESKDGKQLDPNLERYTWFNEGLRMALESAEVGLAQERHNLRRVVLVFDSEDLEKLKEGEFTPDYSTPNGQEEFYQFDGKIPIDLIKEVWIDKENKDMLGLYFIGIVQTMTKERDYKVLNFTEDLSKELLEASEKVYESLCYWYADNLLCKDCLKRFRTVKEAIDEFLYGKQEKFGRFE